MNYIPVTTRGRVRGVTPSGGTGSHHVVELCQPAVAFFRSGGKSSNCSNFLFFQNYVLRIPDVIKDLVVVSKYNQAALINSSYTNTNTSFPS